MALNLFQKQALPRELQRVRTRKLNGVMFRIAVRVLKRCRSLLVRLGSDLPQYDLVQTAREEIQDTHRKLKTSDVWIKNKAILV